MTYSITYHHLDKNNNIISTQSNVACFSYIRFAGRFEINCRYLLFNFRNLKVTQKEATKYLSQRQTRGDS